MGYKFPVSQHFKIFYDNKMHMVEIVHFPIPLRFFNNSK